MNSQPIEEKPKLGQNFQNVCRLCMSEEMVEDVFKFEHEDLARRIFDLLCIVISKDDHISRSICVICRARLNEFSDYKVSCIEVQDLLQKRAGLVKAEVELLVENSETEPVEHPAKKRCVMQSANSLSGPEKCASDVEVPKSSEKVSCEYCNKNVSRIRLKRHMREEHPNANLWTSSVIDQSETSTETKLVGKRYSDSTLDFILTKIRNGDMTVRNAAHQYGIPRGTILYRLSARYKRSGAAGPYTMFTRQEELDIVHLLKDMGRRGFPITRNSLTGSVSCFLKKHPRALPAKNDVPGIGWFRGFSNRHKDLAIRTAESVSSASEEDIREWFRTIESYLTDNNLLSILDDPSRILYGDEAGFCSNPVAKSALATIGRKKVSFVETVNDKPNMTVMFSFRADGTILPSHVIFPQQRLSRRMINSFPKGWSLGTSANGCLSSSNFLLYMKKVVHPFLKVKGVQFPVIYFVDWPKYPIAIDAAEDCSKLGIILFGLFPGAIGILPLKSNWTNVVAILKSIKATRRVRLFSFGPLLQDGMKTAFKQCTIEKGFAECGLFPFNSDAVDFTKCTEGEQEVADIVCDEISLEDIVTDEMVEEENVQEKIIQQETVQEKTAEHDTTQIKTEAVEIPISDDETADSASPNMNVS